MKNICFKDFLAVTIAGLWIVLSEFFRNEFLLKVYWVEHYDSLKLSFKTLPINGMLWTVWSFVLAYLILKLLQKFSLKETIFISWTAAFVLMWISTYNLQVLPLELLYFGIPLSLLEIIIAGLIINKISK